LGGLSSFECIAVSLRKVERDKTRLEGRGVGAPRGRKEMPLGEDTEDHRTERARAVKKAPKSEESEVGLNTERAFFNQFCEEDILNLKERPC
jgi:hypothetical protein